MNLLKRLLFSLFLSFLLSSCTSSPMSAHSDVFTNENKILAESLNVQEMALDEDKIFLITKVTKIIGDKNVSSNRIEWIRKNGGKVTTLIEEELEYKGLVLDRDFVYWITRSKAGSGMDISYLKKILKVGGEPTILFSQEGTIKWPIIQNEKSLFFLAWPKTSPSTSRILQTNKDNNSTLVISEQEESVGEMIIQGDYLYWTTRGYSRVHNEIPCRLNRKEINEEKIETVLSDDCYYFPYVTDQGTYWIGDQIIFIPGNANDIRDILDSSVLFDRTEEPQGTVYRKIDTYLSNVFRIDTTSIYFSEVHTAVLGFKSCTDAGESIVKYSFQEKQFRNIANFHGEIDYFYKIGDFVYLFGECDSFDFQVLHLGEDKIEGVSLGGIEAFAVDDNRIYWTNRDGVLLTRSRDMQ
jgi:hypothetical protein